MPSIWKKKKENKALINAAKKGDVDALQALLGKGVDINTKDRYGMTPLILAAFGGHYNMVEILIDNGADVDAEDKDGNTALLVALNHGHNEIVKLLMTATATFFGNE